MRDALYRQMSGNLKNNYLLIKCLGDNECRALLYRKLKILKRKEIKNTKKPKIVAQSRIL